MQFWFPETQCEIFRKKYELHYYLFVLTDKATPSLNLEDLSWNGDSLHSHMDQPMSMKLNCGKDSNHPKPSDLLNNVWVQPHCSFFIVLVESLIQGNTFCENLLWTLEL